MSLLHVRQIETHLRDTYAEQYWKDELSERHNLSRLLGRYAVDLILGAAASDGSTLVEITDSGEDRGIDAIAVDPISALVVVVQSKWRNDGAGSMDLAGVLKFLAGVRALLDIDGAGPSGWTDAAKTAVRTAMQTPGGRMRLVTATTAGGELAEAVKEPIDELMSVLNDVSDEHPIAEFTHMRQATFFDSMARPPRSAIDLEVQLLDWGRTSTPVTAYYGRANALTVADWFRTSGSGLFAENIRVVLPKSEINESIFRTLTEDPEKFWYYNNGITILAGELKRSLAGATNRDAGFFKLLDASVVNGAQTVSTLGRALAEGYGDALERAYVSVRCIEVADDSPDLARRITRFANTQNVVSSQDFVFLDEEQHRLVKELRLQGYEYILRSGETAVMRERARIIDVRQAAVALACASSLANAVQAKREVSRLFDRESGPYSALFNPSVNGLLVHRSVEVVGKVDQLLAISAKAEDGVKSGVAVHANRVMAHVLLKRLGRARLLDPEFEFGEAVADLDADITQLLDALTQVFPEKAYPGNVFKNRARVEELLRDASIS